jgi:cation/acetate symporter
VLLLGIWWRGLTARGAIAGMAVGAITCGGSILTAPWIDAGILDPLLTQPAAWTVPLATTVVLLVSRLDGARVPRGTARFLAQLHIPERVEERAGG